MAVVPFSLSWPSAQPLRSGSSWSYHDTRATLGGAAGDVERLAVVEEQGRPRRGHAEGERLRRIDARSDERAGDEEVLRRQRFDLAVLLHHPAPA